MEKGTLTITMEKTRLETLRKIAEQEGRTAAGQVRVLIRQFIERYEKGLDTHSTT